MGSKEILKILQKRGWKIVRTKGSHHQLKHPDKPGKWATVPHPKKDLPTGTVKDIENTSGEKLR
jgi:predicted RNA binding protein YcfA (HicA-like mRNA interferase family)